MTDIGEYLVLVRFKLSIWHQQNVRAFIGSYKHEVHTFSHVLANLKIITGILMSWGISHFFLWLSPCSLSCILFPLLLLTGLNQVFNEMIMGSVLLLLKCVGLCPAGSWSGALMSGLIFFSSITLVCFVFAWDLSVESVNYQCLNASKY